MIRKIKEQNLPFGIKRKDRPPILHAVRPKDISTDTEGEYSPITKKIYIYTKALDPYTVEHEVAHYQLRDLRRSEETSLEERAEDEIQADLLCYARIGRPKRYKGRANSILWNLHDKLEAWEVNEKAKRARTFQAFWVAVDKYWKWMPESWREDIKGIPRLPKSKLDEIVKRANIKLEEEYRREHGIPRVTKGMTKEPLIPSPIGSQKMPKEVAIAIGSVKATVEPGGRVRLKVRRL